MDKFRKELEEMKAFGKNSGEGISDGANLLA
jgi:hypothetical protein